MKLTDLIDNTADRHPDQIAVVDGAERVTYRDLMARIDAFADALVGMGVRKGDLVGVRLPNSIDTIALTYAVWRTGATVVPIGIELKTAEVETVCRQMTLKALVTGPHDDFAAPAAAVIGETAYRFQPCDFHARFPESDAAFVRFTSGTTGSFKGVVLSHSSVLDRLAAVDKAFRISPSDRVLWLLSMAHHFVSTIVLYLSRGATVVLTKGHLASSILTVAEQEDVTVMYASPFHYALLAADRSSAALPSVRMAVSTTADLPESVQQGFRRRFGFSVCQAYGIIELGLVCVNVDQPAERPRSVGRVLPDYQVAVRNTAEYTAAGGECGEIHFKGPGFFDGYFSPLKKAEEVMVDGWFNTGDIGRIDDDGYVYLLGRKKELVNVAGMKVFPREVEAAIELHPQVKESRVYGIKDDYSGEVVAADVVADPGTVAELTTGDLAAHCRQRLATYKIPRRFNIVDAIPKTAVTAKIVRI